MIDDVTILCDLTLQALLELDAARRGAGRPGRAVQVLLEALPTEPHDPEWIVLYHNILRDLGPCDLRTAGELRAVIRARLHAAAVLVTSDGVDPVAVASLFRFVQALHRRLIAALSSGLRRLAA